MSPRPHLHRLRTPVALTAPLWRHVELLGADEPVVLLDSALPGEPLGRWSFLGLGTAALLTGDRHVPAAERPVRWRGPGRPFSLERTIRRRPDGSLPARPEVVRTVGDPFATLRALQAAYAAGAPAEPAPAPPFTGGLMGVFGFGTAHAVEALPLRPTRPDEDPDLAFAVVDEVLLQDHRNGGVELWVTGRGGDPAAARRDADTRTTAWLARLAAFAPTGPELPDGAVPAPLPPVSAGLDPAAYRAAVERCREHILAGDAFEVCLTDRLEAPLPGRPWDLYRILRAINPAPFAAWLQLPGCRVACASPERFLRLDGEGSAESRPIKGTRPRGADTAADERLRADLAASAKDRAENLMIVDLVRNDLGRVADSGSVSVPELLVVESYATVHQLVSTVRARLRDGLDAMDLVRACFPGGSMTGAPKVEALKIIDRLEPSARDLYSGAIGYWDRSGRLDLNIVIRTLVCRDGRARCGVGGAVTADSDPAAEYQESRDKAAALVRALALAALAGPGDRR